MTLRARDALSLALIVGAAVSGCAVFQGPESTTVRQPDGSTVVHARQIGRDDAARSGARARFDTAANRACRDGFTFATPPVEGVEMMGGSFGEGPGTNVEATIRCTATRR